MKKSQTARAVRPFPLRPCLGAIPAKGSRRDGHRKSESASDNSGGSRAGSVGLSATSMVGIGLGPHGRRWAMHLLAMKDLAADGCGGRLSFHHRPLTLRQIFLARWRHGCSAGASCPGAQREWIRCGVLCGRGFACRHSVDADGGDHACLWRAATEPHVHVGSHHENEDYHHHDGCDERRAGPIATPRCSLASCRGLSHSRRLVIDQTDDGWRWRSHAHRIHTFDHHIQRD